MSQDKGSKQEKSSSTFFNLLGPSLKMMIYPPQKSEYCQTSHNLYLLYFQDSCKTKPVAKGLVQIKKLMFCQDFEGKV